LRKFYPTFLYEINAAVLLRDAAEPHTWAKIFQGLGFADSLAGIAQHRSHQLQQASGCSAI
jgi:hypothetical protein